MALGVYTECTKLWKLDDLSLIVDSVESYVLDAMQAQHIKTGNNYLNILLFAFGKSVATMQEIMLCLFLRNIGKIITFKIMWMTII